MLLTLYHVIYRLGYPTKPSSILRQQGAVTALQLSAANLIVGVISLSIFGLKMAMERCCRLQRKFAYCCSAYADDRLLPQCFTGVLALKCLRAFDGIARVLQPTAGAWVGKCAHRKLAQRQNDTMGLKFDRSPLFHFLYTSFGSYLLANLLII